tara:strand:- start:2597 stop:4561 length:1965 start_codon:yes stop_codon:yes gene_type:complete
VKLEVVGNIKKKILVVDDTEATRYAVARTLRASGYETIEAASGLQALELVATEKPDLVTLDIHLPDINGFEVCRRIKGNPRTSHIPVLQVSASYVTSKDRIHGLEGGADNYLTHPFEPPVLLATVKALLRSRKLMDDLRLTDERFRVALKYAPIMIYTTDADLRYSWVYNAPDQLNEEFFVGKKDADIFSEEEARKLSQIKTEVLTTGVGQHLTMSITISGRLHCYDMTIEQHLSTDGDVEGVMVACIEVTERLKAEEAQKQALEDAEFANQSKTRFLSNMSHEIRTPLGVIEGFADLALDPNTCETDRNTYLTTIKRNAQGLTKLLGEILDLSKVEAGRMEIEITSFSLTELLNELVETFSLTARNRGLNLDVEFVGPFPNFVNSDPVRVRQILTNLISNALKFTERGGVKISARADARQSVTSPVSVEIQVRDSGIGLTEVQKKRLFEAFVQADSSTTRKFGGTGLGLNLSKKLAHSLGGNLVMTQSDPQKGSTFTFTMNAGVLTDQDFSDRFRSLPINQKNYQQSEYANELTGLSILLVEDSLDNQMLFARYLENAGAKVEIANDGLEAIDKVEEKTYDAILMDVQMPNLDGYEATRLIRTSGIKTPIIALTAHALKEERDRAMALGFDNYLTKPLNVRQLISMLSLLKAN